MGVDVVDMQQFCALVTYSFLTVYFQFQSKNIGVLERAFSICCEVSFEILDVVLAKCNKLHVIKK